jgi:hypothetical protein
LCPLVAKKTARPHLWLNLTRTDLDQFSGPLKVAKFARNRFSAAALFWRDFRVFRGQKRPQVKGPDMKKRGAARATPL